MKAHSIYCHTHGACTHTSKECKWPKSGHKKEATFKNMMGGSTAYCQQCSWKDGTESSLLKIKQNLNTLSIVPLLTSNPVIAKADSGASNHYWRPQDTHCLTNLRQYSGPSVILPDADTLSPSQQGTIDISPGLSSLAQTATVLPNLRSSSLISLGQICDSDCTIIMNNKKLYAAKSSNIDINVNNDDILMTF